MKRPCKLRSVIFRLSPESYDYIIQAGLLAYSCSNAFPSKTDSGKDCPNF